jgi:hypothetical protein
VVPMVQLPIQNITVSSCSSFLSPYFCKDYDLWQALQGREGAQLLCLYLVFPQKQQQECAVTLLALLSKENDERKWVIIVADAKGENGRENSLTIFTRISFYSVGNRNGKVRNGIRPAKSGPSKMDKSEQKCLGIDRQTVI